MCQKLFPRLYECASLPAIHSLSVPARNRIKSQNLIESSSTWNAHFPTTIKKESRENSPSSSQFSYVEQFLVFFVYARVNSQKWKISRNRSRDTHVKSRAGFTLIKAARLDTPGYGCWWWGLWMVWLKGLHRHKRMANSSSSSNSGRGRPMAIYEILWTMWHPISIRRTIIASGKITIFWCWSHHYNLIHSFWGVLTFISA